MAYVALARQTIPFGTGKFWHDVATTASRSCREDEQVYRRADRIRFEAGRAGHARRGGMPQDGKQRQDVLHIWNWKAKFGGMTVSEAQRLKELEQENNKLKRLLAESMLDNAALKELLAGK